MMRLGKDFESAIDRELKAAGIDRYQIEPGGKHPRLVFTYQGRSQSFILAGSPSDHRALLNMIHDLRALLGTTTTRPPPAEILPDPAARDAARRRVAANPPSRATDKDLRLLALLDDTAASPATVGRRARADAPDAWGLAHLDRLERLVALGLAEADSAGRYRRADGAAKA